MSTTHTIKGKALMLLPAAALALLSTLASAEGTAARRHGDHPAVVVQRLYAAQTYDYASKFYPHPAKLYLVPDSPRPVADPADARAREAGLPADGIPVAHLPSHDGAVN